MQEREDFGKNESPEIPHPSRPNNWLRPIAGRMQSNYVLSRSNDVIISCKVSNLLKGTFQPGTVTVAWPSTFPSKGTAFKSRILDQPNGRESVLRAAQPISIHEEDCSRRRAPSNCWRSLGERKNHLWACARQSILGWSTLLRFFVGEKHIFWMIPFYSQRSFELV